MNLYFDFSLMYGTASIGTAFEVVLDVKKFFFDFNYFI